MEYVSKLMLILKTIKVFNTTSMLKSDEELLVHVGVKHNSEFQMQIDILPT